MAEEKPQELLIIKRTRGGSDSGHGGAWKIAFADFMTAMMALFLVLWLISATNEKTKASLARYFNPVKLVDMTIQKRGLNDPSEHSTEDAVDNNPPPTKALTPPKPDGKQPPKSSGAKARKSAGAGYQPTHSEAALFRDPYAVLAEIDATGGAVKTPSADHSNVGASASFQDPFQTATPEVPKPTPPQPVPARRPGPGTVSVSGTPPSAAPAPEAAAKAVEKATKTPSSPSPAAVAALSPKEVAPSAAKSVAVAGTKDQWKPQVADRPTSPPNGEAANAREAARLRQQIAEAIGKGGAVPNIEVTSTRQGVLISLTDGINYAMFAIGSAEPQRRTVQVMAKIAQILKKAKGSIIISGHTDGRRYRTRTYDNWRLSTARAQMALYMLVRGGLSENRIEKIEGAADHQLKVPGDPLAAQNRRIDILLREAKS